MKMTEMQPDRSAADPHATITPMFQCTALAETLRFYRALGFEVTHEQYTPYQYGATRWGPVGIDFHGVRKVDPRHASSCIIMIDDVAMRHRAFVEPLRREYGGLPVTGTPRVTRLRQHHTRFAVYDPDGNTVLFIARDEPEYDYSANVTEDDDSNFGRTLSGVAQTQSPLMLALEIAVFLRDTYHNDKGAAGKLDRALSAAVDAPAVERARALAARAELAVALGDRDRANTLRAELAAVPLSDDERTRYRDELRAADELERLMQPVDG